MNNSSLNKNLKSFLNQVVLDKTLHVRWLNTLAFLEHIGSRKLIKSQDSARLNRILLQHISEEARHAYYFKNLAYRLAPKECPTFEKKYMIEGEASEDYFQLVDHQAEASLSEANLKKPAIKKELNYLYTTWMVEERAVMLYEMYNEVLKEKKQSFNLNFILQEEDQHLKIVKELIEKKDPDFKKRSDSLLKYENSEFSKLVQTWQAAIA